MIWPVLLMMSFVHANVKGIIVDTKNRVKNFKNYTVWIKEGERLKKLPGKKNTLFMNQIDKEFIPRSVALHVGDKVAFRNKDLVYHNVFSLDPKHKFDLGMIKKSSNLEKTLHIFKKPGHIIVFCNIHPEMMGTIHVFNHRYFGMVKPKGEFLLPKVPKGKYTLMVAGPRIKKFVTHTFSYPFKEPLKITFAAEKKKFFVEHKRKDGKEYPMVDEDDFY